MLVALNFPEEFVQLIVECISTPSFSLALNGEVFGFFKARRGIRQGDPLSPLLFTICMKYLSRVIQVVQDYEGFKYHPLCRPLKLSHLCFADDLLLFCKGEKRSVTILLRAFETFSCASGLAMNKSKSCMYGNGISRGSLEELCQLAGITIGTLPFKYLGVPIISKRLAASDCAKLVERVVERIRAIGARKLSYAGRLVLIKSMLSTLHCYWARIFVLPVSILNKIEAICRSFLWQGKEVTDSPALVAWDKCCTPKAEGGLGIKDLRRWNTATLGKYIWWLAQKEDHLWVKWIHAVYMKNEDWQTYTPKVGASWAWKKLCGIKEKLKSGYAEEWWLSSGNCYSVQQGYQWLRGQGIKVDWAPFVWNNVSLPKHCFLGWLVVHGRLLTRDRLKKMQICEDIGCVMCGRADENHKHIFFECDYSKLCLGLLKDMLKVNIPTSEFVHWWLKKRFKSLLRKKMVAAGMQALLYRIWEQRNKCRLEERLVRPEVLLRTVKDDIILRMKVIQRQRPTNDDYKEWIN